MKKFISILITIVLVISFTSCNSKNVSVLNAQKQDFKKVLTSNEPKQVETNSNSMYIPPEQSREELYQDIFISILMPDIQKSVAAYYLQPLMYRRSYPILSRQIQAGHHRHHRLNQMSHPCRP